MSMKSKKIVELGLNFIVIGILLGLDQWTKYLSATYLKGSSGIVLIPGVFELQYVENFGAAFGILQKQRIFLILFSVLILCLLFFIFHKIPEGKRFMPLKIVLLFLTSGALGNMADRFLKSYVVDFFYFKVIDFPVFNVADCYVVCSVIFAFILVCFYYKDDELNFMKKEKV